MFEMANCHVIVGNIDKLAGRPWSFGRLDGSLWRTCSIRSPAQVQLLTGNMIACKIVVWLFVQVLVVVPAQGSLF